MIRSSRQRLPRFKLDTHVMEFKVKTPPEDVNSRAWVEHAFREVYSRVMKAGGRGMNRMCLSFNFANMQKDNAWISPRAIKGYEFQDLWNLVESVAQSANGFACADTFWIKLHVAEAPTGQGGSVSTELRAKCVLTIKNKDGLCLARSLVAAKVHAQKLKSGAVTGILKQQWQNMRQDKGKIQRVAAEQLTTNSGVSIPSEGCGPDEIRQYQRYLALEGYVIKVYSFIKNGKDNPVVFDGTAELTGRGIPVKYVLRIVNYPEDNHYQPILNLAAYFGFKYYCEQCNKPYSHKGHICVRNCDRCLKNPPCDNTVVYKIVCDDCNRDFHGQICFEQHKRTDSVGVKKLIRM